MVQARTRSLELHSSSMCIAQSADQHAGLSKEQGALAGATDYQHRGRATLAAIITRDKTPWNAKLLAKRRDGHCHEAVMW